MYMQSEQVIIIHNYKISLVQMLYHKYPTIYIQKKGTPLFYHCWGTSVLVRITCEKFVLVLLK